MLTGPAPGASRPARSRGATYSAAAIEARRAIWDAAGYPWSRRLHARLPLGLPWARRRLRLPPTVEDQLRAISPRQMDLRLASYRRQLTTRPYGRTRPGTLLKHHIPLRTDRWGFTEIDLVAHCGSCGNGEFVHSLNLTDGHTTWGGDDRRARQESAQIGDAALEQLMVVRGRLDERVEGSPSEC